MWNIDNELMSEAEFVDANNNDWQELSTNMSWDNTNEVIDELEESQYTLSKGDFQKYFEWENFKQVIWNCYMIAVIDSLVSFWGYERLIRTSVKKNKNGFSITIPLWYTEWFWKTYFISFDEIRWNQVNILGNTISLVKWKSWIKALLIAYWKMCTWKNYYDNGNFVWWESRVVFEDLVFSMDTTRVSRGIVKWEDEDPDWLADQEFVKSFKNTLEMFDKNRDMIVLSVHHKGIWYSTLWHYSHSNHAISVENVRNEGWELIITLSDPSNSAQSYDIPFRELIKSCYRYVLCTEPLHHGPCWKIKNKTYEHKREYSASEWDQKIRNINSVNQVVQLTWEENKFLREARWDIVVTAEKCDWYDILKVSSFGMDRKIDLSIEEGNVYIINIYDWNDKLEIPWWSLSKYYEYGWKVEEYSNFPFFLYWPKIANFISRMRHDYIDSKKYDMKNLSPFCIKDWLLQFDDNPSKFSWKDWVKRIWAELVGDDYIECLKDWKSLWIDPSDEETKQKIADFLNVIVNKCRG